MTFADQYANHAYADLIREAETQGIGIGASQERERIIALLQDHVCPACETHYKKYELQSILYVEYPHQSCEGLLCAIALIKGESH